MGSGKTYWGQLWAKDTSLPFFDMDKLIENEEKETVDEIFKRNGEEYFRQKEKAVLRAFKENDNCIIACGGGSPCFNNNIQWMNENGFTIYLKSSPRDILKRVLKGQNKRPLIKDLNEEALYLFIQQKLIEREPFYNQAKIILRTDELSPNTLSTLNLKL